jgi:hypothetical protein
MENGTKQALVKEIVWGAIANDCGAPLQMCGWRDPVTVDWEYS